MDGDGAPDFIAILRRQQTVEYRKLCRELRLPENSAVIKVFTPPRRKASQGAEEEVQVDPGTHAYDFSGCYLGDRQLRPLAAALAVDRQLAAVRLPGVGFADPGMVALCEQLKRSTQLLLLDVSGNRFSSRGADACLALVRGAPRLREVLFGDTVLDAEFCERRGLPSKFVACRLALTALFAPRLAKAAAEAEIAQAEKAAKTAAAATSQTPHAESDEIAYLSNQAFYDADELEARRILGVSQPASPQAAAPQPSLPQAGASNVGSPAEAQ